MADRKRSAGFKSAAFILLIALCAVVGGAVFADRSLSWVMLSGAVLICGIFFCVFEQKNSPAGETAALAVLTALSIIGRIALAAVPAFKPCSAVIIIAGIYFGSQQGFMVGALTALVSNFYFSQGMWTPFQMIIWGLTGFFAGLLWKLLSRSRIALAVYGVMAGVVFSLFMDLWSAVWADNGFTLARFLALTASSAWFTLCYAVSNVIFLMIFIKPSKRIFGRLSVKYGIGREISQ